MRGDFQINGNVCAFGSVSWGTHRPEDLIPAFCAEIRKLSLRTPDVVYEAESWLESDESTRDGSEGSEIVAALFDQLDHMAPDGVYFGACEGDGADFGFWPTETDED